MRTEEKETTKCHKCTKKRDQNRNVLLMEGGKKKAETNRTYLQKSDMKISLTHFHGFGLRVTSWKRDRRDKIGQAVTINPRT